MKAAGLLVLASACTFTQSARTLPPGSTEASVGLGRLSLLEEDVDEGTWASHVGVRFGIIDGFDMGVHLLHTPGAGGAGAFAFDPKVRLLQRGRLTLAIGSPAGLVIEEYPAFTLAGWFVWPGLYLSLETSATAELVLNIRYDVGAADSEDPLQERSIRTGPTISFGPRFFDETGTWAVLPEIGFSQIEDGSFLSFGVTIAVGK